MDVRDKHEYLCRGNNTCFIFSRTKYKGGRGCKRGPILLKFCMELARKSNFDVLRSVSHGHYSIDIKDVLLEVYWRVVADFYQNIMRRETNLYGGLLCRKSWFCNSVSNVGMCASL